MDWLAPFTILAYIQLHSTPLYDCLEILKAIEHQCMRVEGMGWKQLWMSSRRDRVFNRLFGCDSSDSFDNLQQVVECWIQLWFIMCSSPLHFDYVQNRYLFWLDLYFIDNICPLLQKQQYIQMTMQLMTSINQHKPALLDVFVPTFVVPSCFALYYLTSYGKLFLIPIHRLDDATILCLFMENGLGDYLSSFFNYNALFTYQRMKNSLFVCFSSNQCEWI